MRSAFTLIELLVVLGIMVLIGGLAAPAMVQAAQRARISDGAGRIHHVWNQARLLAMTERPLASEDVNGNGSLDPGEDRNGNTVLDAPLQAWHYGLVLVQPADGTPWVGLIFDNRSAAAIAADPEASLLMRGAGEPVLRRQLPDGVRLHTAAAFDGAASATQTVLAVYAQFGTGSPIHPTAVAAGAGASAGLVSLGTKTSPAAGYPGTLLLAPAPFEAERSVRISIHEVGLCAVEVR